MGEKSDKENKMQLTQDQLISLFKDFVSQWEKTRSETTEPEINVSNFRKMKLEIKKSDDRFSVKVKVKPEKSVKESDDDDDEDDDDEKEELKDVEKKTGKKLKRLLKNFSDGEMPDDESVKKFVKEAGRLADMLQKSGMECDDYLSALDGFKTAWEEKDIPGCQQKCEMLNQQLKSLRGKEK